MRFVENHRRRLVDELRNLLGAAESATFAVAYIRRSGVQLLRRELQALRQRGGIVRILFTVNPPISEAAAVRSLLDLGIAVRVYNAPHVFHPKGYVFTRGNGSTAVIGSANLSGSALTQGREWCLVGTDLELPIDELNAEFERLWISPYAADVAEDDLQLLGRHVMSPDLRAVAEAEDQVAAIQAPAVDEVIDYVVRRRPDDADYWWFQLYVGPMNARVVNGTFNVVVIVDFEAPTERHFVVPYEFIRDRVLPNAGRDVEQNRYLFQVDKTTLRFRWTGGFTFEGGQFLLHGDAA
jgi:HKD family nuclease